MVSCFRRFMGLLLVVGLMCAALVGAGQAAAPVDAPAAKAAPATGKEIAPDSNPFNVFDAIWGTYGARNYAWFRNGFVNEVRLQSGPLAAAYVDLEWAGSVNQLTTLSGRSPLTERVVRDGMARYYRDLGYTRSATNMSIGVGMGLRWAADSDYTPDRAGDNVGRAK